MRTTFCCLRLVLLLANFHGLPEAVHSVEQNPAILAYNRGYGICREVTSSSSPEIKLAADEACDQAFRALDDLKINSCPDWRQGACRVGPGDQYQHYECTCMMPTLGAFSFKSYIVRPFRDCAPVTRVHEKTSATEPAPTQNFQQGRSNYDDTSQLVNGQQTYDQYGYHGQTGIPMGLYASGSENPSAANPSYAEGSSSGVASKPGRKRKFGLTLPYPCDQCDDHCRSARALFNHKRLYHTQGDTHCYICNKTFKAKKSFMGHLKTQHPELGMEEIESQTFSAELEAILPFACTVCPKRFSLDRSLAAHMKSHITDDTTCPVCGRTLSSRPSLEYHMQSAHPGTPIPERGSRIREPEPGDFVCGQCGRPYASAKSLREHVKVHNSLLGYCCSCDRTFGTNFSYRRHLKKRHPEFAAAEKAAANAKYEMEHPYMCKQCGKRFKDTRALRQHKAVHAGKTKCDECGLILTTVSYLNKHKKKDHPK